MKPPTRAAPLEISASLDGVDASATGLRGFWRRMALAVAAASFVGTLTAAIDAAWAREALEGTKSPGFTTIARFDTGLVAPLAIAIGVLVGVAAFVLEPDRARSPSEIWHALDTPDRARNDRLAGFLLGLGLGLGLWATEVAHWAKSAMSAPGSSMEVGLTLAAIALGAFVLVLIFSLAAAELFAFLLRITASEVLPSHALLAGLALTVSIVGMGIKVGTTSGDGGWLGIWGVMKRPELDLRAPALMSLLVVGGYLVPHLVQRSPWIALAIGGLPLAFTYEAAVGLAADPDVAAAIERGAPLGKACLGLLRRATDRDHDGYSPWFGGGDCNDQDPSVNPGAQDVPDNGVDEDCSGAAAVSAPRTTEPAKPLPTGNLLPKGRNLILITVDTLRADMGFAGNPKPVSPNLDALAAKSVVFDRAYSLASYTGKSLGPLLIGKYPSETHRGWGHFNRYSAEDTMVAQRLQKAGIRTIAVQAHWYMSGPAFGLARGFDVVDKSGQPPAGTDQDNDATVTGQGLTEAALRVLAKPENTSKRFFTWIHYLDPHSEYARHPGAPDFGSGPRAAYDGEVWYTDGQIGRVLAFVASQPWGPNTAIIVTSDHGEAFGEHHMIRHGVEIWEELVRVPLLFFVPGIAPHHVLPPRSAVDIVPTILDLFDLVIPEDAGFFDFVSGQSLADDIALPRGYEPTERDVLVDMPPGPNNDERRALIRGGMKLYVSGAVRYTLFDLEHDPGEKNALDDKTRLSEMKARYQWHRTLLREVPVKPVAKEPTATP